MGRSGVIQRNKEGIIGDLKETTLSLKILGEKYGVTKQALSLFAKKEGIKRPAKLYGHQVDSCHICQWLLQISKAPRSEFLTARTIREKLGASVSYLQYLRHLKILKQKGLVHQKFGCLASKKLEKAYAMYFTEKLPVYRIGKKAGLKNFGAIIKRHRKSGWNVPPPLFVYKGKERSRIVQAANQRRLRELKRGNEELAPNPLISF